MALPTRVSENLNFCGWVVTLSFDRVAWGLAHSLHQCRNSVKALCLVHPIPEFQVTRSQNKEPRVTVSFTVELARAFEILKDSAPQSEGTNEQGLNLHSASAP